MLHVGLDLSRARLDVCVLDEVGELVAQTAVPPDGDGLLQLAQRARGQRVRAVIAASTLVVAGSPGRMPEPVRIHPHNRPPRRKPSYTRLRTGFVRGKTRERSAISRGTSCDSAPH
jgi:hypothetical protein